MAAKVIVRAIISFKERRKMGSNFNKRKKISERFKRRFTVPEHAVEKVQECTFSKLKTKNMEIVP
jgi:hypothetical protein